MEALRASYFAEICGGELFGDDKELSFVVHDNREVLDGSIFVAIRGERFDGHDFLKGAQEAGAAAALVSRRIPEVDIPQIVVQDTVSALGRAAEAYIKTLPAKRLCITGSVGKTTTKEMCAVVLSESFKTHKTAGNYNNNIGLPLTVFGMDKSHEAAVLEIGTNHFGEILPLAKIASPDVALITTIAESHLEAFKTKEGVLSEKTEIFKGLSEDGIAVLNGDDPLLWGYRSKLNHKCVWFGIENKECDVLGEIVENNTFASSFRVKDSDVLFSLPCGGEHNIRDALSAIAVGRVFGMQDAAIARGLSKFVNTGMRQNIYEYNGVRIIRDCYNANPESMRAAFSLLGGPSGSGKKICALGDMLELGDNAAMLHREVGAAAAKNADMIMATGEFANDYKLGAGNDKTQVFADKKEMSDALKNILKPGDTLLVKGSAGTRMWQVLEYLQGEKE
ncbi:MAG: UDP-N-acetylmuramoyl-tripeptide--D-alanyl-D-alanine ligase [Oscillospiraceae bacterium]|nr:UDP-N-acetylmuramoyl-tripeptide--D-alanyl-D-alanine ligase [Oscillospiraceae bacterium]